MKPTNFFSIRLLLPLLLIFVSCGKNSEDLQYEKIDNDSLILMAMELFEDLDQSLPDQKLALRISLDENGKGTVHFSATENIQSDIHDFQGVKVSSLEEEGTECSTPIGCLKEAKKCLDDGQDAVISNGPCATYCATCQEPE